MAHFGHKTVKSPAVTIFSRPIENVPTQNKAVAHPMFKHINIKGPVRTVIIRLFQRISGFAADGACAIPRPAFGAVGGMEARHGPDRPWNFNGIEDEIQSSLPGTGKPLAASTGQAGGGPSLTVLYQKHGPSLYWVCMRYTRSREDAEDVVQQVFMKAQKNLQSFRGQSSLYTWLYRIAVNECLDLFRKRKFQAEGNPTDLEHLVPVFPEGEMDARLDLERIMKETDPQTMEILFLLYMEGLTQDEVVEVLGVSRSTINRKINAFKAAREGLR
jgi:RNA polymerase sigma-70 factor, ECF subfamily